MTGPNFSPKGGIGTIWKDPTTGKNWKYTQNGWVEEGSGDIATDTQNNGTFTVKPEEEGLVTTLKTGGAKEADIQNALKQRQQILATKQTDTTNQGDTIDALKTDSADPFKGKTKTEVLREAFNNGVTDNSELEKISKTYDLLASQMDMTNTDTSKLTTEQQQAMKSQIEKQAVTKIQSLPDAVSRDSALTSLTTFKNGEELISMLEDGKVKTGLIVGGARKGVFGIGARSLGKTTKDEDYWAALSETFAANFRKAISGTAVSEPEMRRLDAFLPNETKTAQANIEGIKAISDYLSNKTSLQLGMDVSILKPEQTGSDPLNLFGDKKSKENPLGI